MPVYNGERFLREALDSVLAQTYANFELLISDNASTDSTADICREYASRDRRIHYVRQERNRGILENTAYVMDQASARYFMLVGDDDVYDPAYLATMVALMEASEEVVLAFSGYAYIGERGEKSELQNVAMKAEPGDSRFANLGKFMLHRSCLPMMMGLFRTEALRKALPMPYERLRPMTGDVDNVFLAKLVTLGRLVSTPQALFCYRLKDRSPSFPVDWPPNARAQLLYILRHHARVRSLIASVIHESTLSRPQKAALLGWNWVAFVLVYGVFLRKRLRDALAA